MKLVVEYWRGEGPAVAPDPELPCVLEVLDEDRLLQALGRAFPERAFTEPTEVLDVTYVPRRQLTVTVAVPDGPGSSIVTVNATPDGPGVAEATDGTRVLDGWGATATMFPADPNLHALERLADPDAMAGVLGWLTGDTHTVEGFELVRYVPGQKCVARLYVGAGEVFCRHFALGLARDADQRLRALWTHPDRTFAMPEPMGAEERLNARFERAAPGYRLDLVLVGDALVDQIAADVANLHRLNGTAIPELGAIGPGKVIGRIERTSARKLRLAFPDLNDRLERYTNQLRGAAGYLPERAPRMLHGDLHPGNVIVADTPTLVGFDSLTVGDPAFDLAVLGSGLVLAALEQESSLERAARAVERLPTAYEAGGGDPVPGDTYAWYLAAALIGWQAEACLQALAPRARDLTKTLLDAADAVFRDGARSSAFIEVTD